MPQPPLAPLADALRRLVVVAEVDEDPDGRGLHILLVNGKRLQAEVRTVAHPSTRELEGIARAWRRSPDRARLLVADAVPAEARQALIDAGVSFFDRRGRLALIGGDVLVEADTDPLPRHIPRAAAAAIRGEAGIAVAVSALMSPEQPAGVREISRVSGMSPAAVSNARQQLRDARLLDGGNRPLVPELFWALAGAWTPAWFDLPDWPGGEPAGATLDRRYAAGLRAPLIEDFDTAVGVYRPGRAASPDDPHAGWAMTGTLAAAHYGADVIPGGGAVPELLVPEHQWHLVAAHVTGVAGSREAVARLAVAPTGIAVRVRRPGHPFPVAHPLVVALSLAQDPSRGQEILDTFAPEGCHVVWR